MKSFQHFNAKSVDEAVSLLDRPNSKVIAGGTDII
jgi:CO/xanthine dehydrogenase FAD-binding subunit